MRWINDNGSLRAADAAVYGANSPAALYGDGLFETIRIEREILFLWDRHWARLSEGCVSLLLDLPSEWSADFFRDEIERTVAANVAGDSCKVRLHIYSFEGIPPQDAQVGYTIVCSALPGNIAEGGPGLRLGIATAAVKNYGPTSRLKTCNALPYSIAAREAKTRKWDDAILLNSAGQVVETTKYNVFFAKSGIMFVATPAEGCIAGVMRAQLLAWLPQWGFPVSESSFEVDDLLNADEVFLTNALRRVQVVAQIGERAYQTSTGRYIAAMVERKFIQAL